MDAPAQVTHRRSFAFPDKLSPLRAISVQAWHAVLRPSHLRTEIDPILLKSASGLLNPGSARREKVQGSKQSLMSDL
jgi:hypothetical protein